MKRAEVLFGEVDRETAKVICGGCLCGEIRYEAEGTDLGSAYCHCRMCQKFTGSPATVGTGIKKHLFRVTKGKPKSYASSKIGKRAFCANCGSSLWMSWPDCESRLDWIFIHTATLDNPNLAPPSSHTGIESQLKWHDVHDDLPRGTCEDSPQIADAWESAGVKITDYPRNVNLD